MWDLEEEEEIRASQRWLDRCKFSTTTRYSSLPAPISLSSACPSSSWTAAGTHRLLVRTKLRSSMAVGAVTEAMALRHFCLHFIILMIQIRLFVLVWRQMVKFRPVFITGGCESQALHVRL